MSDSANDMPTDASVERAELAEEERRTFLTRIAKVSMLVGLAAGYGTCGVIGVRYLLPSGSRPRSWQLIGPIESIPVGAAIAYLGPSGQKITITRLADRGDATDFIALSSVCPHLGCQVHWRPEQKQFVCPCHNGVFDAVGKGIAGPPGKAGQSLSQFPLKVEAGLLVIEVPLPTVSERASERDPALAQIRRPPSNTKRS